ncbi:LacI family DNA-binding transcriptional regulator [Eionea flava]
MSIKKVAEIAGVSIATVSRYFSKPDLLKNDTYENVKRAVNQINYKPNTLAQNFRRGKSGLIVVVVDNIGNPIYENFTHIITHIAQSSGYDVFIKESSSTHLTIKYYQDMLDSKQADGIILMTDLPHIHQASRSIIDELPIIFIDSSNSTIPDTPYSHINLDNYQAAQSATQHLLTLGHENITCVTPEDVNSTYIHRVGGYKAAIESAGLKTQQVLYACQSPSNIEKLVERVLYASPAVTALFCTDDDIAIDILPLLKQQGRIVPDDISVIGFNNIRYSARTSPPLSTVELPLADIATQAIQQLCAKIDTSYQSTNDDYSEISSPLKHQLILRESTASPSS